MEDDLNILANGRPPQYFGKWKTTKIFWQREEGRQPQYVGKWKNDINFLKLETLIGTSNFYLAKVTSI